jgi:hypothetical protein
VTFDLNKAIMDFRPVAMIAAGIACFYFKIPDVISGGLIMGGATLINPSSFPGGTAVGQPKD